MMQRFGNVIPGFDGVPDVIIPTTDRWDEIVQRLVGRPLSDDETKKAAKMKSHNWTCRLAAETILGRVLTFEEVESAKIHQ